MVADYKLRGIALWVFMIFGIIACKSWRTKYVLNLEPLFKLLLYRTAYSNVVLSSIAVTR